MLPTWSDIKSALPALTLIISPIMVLSESIYWIESSYVSKTFHIPAPLIALMIAAIIAIIVTNLVEVPSKFQAGLQFSTRWLLKIGIILYGINFSYALWLKPGAQWILVLGLVSLCSPMVAIYLLSHFLKVDSDSSILVAVGTGVCGISAIVATQQALDSDQDKAGMALATILVFGTLVLFLYPFLAVVLHLNDFAYGLWTGATTLDLPQLVAASLQGGGATALLPALWVKSIRIGFLVPVILIFLFRNRESIVIASKSQLSSSEPNGTLKKAGQSFPLFILIFFGMILLNTVMPMPQYIASSLATGKGEPLGLNVANILLMSAIIAICFRVRYDVVGKAGWKVLVLGGIAWSIQSLVVLLLVHYLVPQSF